MKVILDYLEQLEFSKLEATLYLALLKSGPLTVAELAEAAHINRTAAYGYIHSLLEKGIIAKVTGTSNKITANPPEHLHYLVEQKATAVKNLQTNLPNIITSLNQSFPQKKPNSNSEMKYYKGKSGVKTIYEDCLKSEMIRSYFTVRDLEKVFPENLDLFNQAINQKPEMEVHELVEQSTESGNQIERSRETKRHIYKYLPDDIKLTSNDILIYDGKVAIINIGDKHNVTGVVLQNKDYYNNSKQLFDLLWRMLPEPTALY